MNYILIDYEKVSLSYLQSVIETDSQFYIFINRQKNTSVPLEFVELFLNHGKIPYFINIHAELPKSLSLQWAFLIGQIIGKDIHAKIHIFADQGELSFLSALGEQDQIQWVSAKKSNSLQEEPVASLVVEKPTAIERTDEEVSLESAKDEEILSESESENEATPNVVNQDMSQPVENKKERLKKQAILANEVEFVRFTTNYIFNLFSTNLYTQKITPPDLVIDLKNLLITEYFPPEENFTLSEQTDNIIENVFSRLTKKEFIHIEGEKVIYHLTPQFIYDSFVQLLNQQQPKKYNGIVHIAKTELFFLKDDDQNINILIERAKDEGHFRLQNKRVIYSAKKENDATKDKQHLQLKEIKVKKNLSAHHPKISLLMPRSEKIKKDADNHFQQALQLIKTPNRPKSIKHLKRFLSAKIPTDHHGIDQLVKRLFKERYIIVSNDDKISYRTELIKSSHYEKIVQFLKNGSQFKPKEEVALLNSIRSYLGDKISQAECQAIVKQLIDDGYIRIENGIAQYQL